MGLADDMKKLNEEILASYKTRAEEYQQRLKDNETLVSEVQETLDGFRKSHLEMAANLNANAATLRADLSKGEEERLNAFRNLMGGIGESISSIQSEVKDIQQSTANLLDTFSTSRSEMANELNKRFEQARTDRKKQNQDRHDQNLGRLKDFDAMMKNIQDDVLKSKSDVNTILTDTNELLKKFAKEHAVMSTTMRNDLNENLQGRVTYTRELLKTFHGRLTEIGNENKKMAEELRKGLIQSRKDLSDSDAKRLSDFEQSMGEIRTRVSQIQNTVTDLLNNLSDNRVRAAEEWEQLSEAIADIKGRAAAAFQTEKETTTRKETISDKKKAAKETENPEAAKAPEEPEATKTAEQAEITENSEEVSMEEEETSVKEKEVIEFPKEMSLEEKIIMFVNRHPEGVKVSEMEVALGEQRMRIGYACKKLLETGKLSKLGSAYFPKNEKKEQ
jgi:hypothetical protein